MCQGVLHLLVHTQSPVRMPLSLKASTPPVGAIVTTSETYDNAANMVAVYHLGESSMSIIVCEKHARFRNGAIAPDSIRPLPRNAA